LKCRNAGNWTRLPALTLVPYSPARVHRTPRYGENAQKQNLRADAESGEHNVLRQEDFNLAERQRQLLVHNAPHRVIFDRSVMMYEYVPESNDLSMLANARGSLRLLPCQDIQRLTDNLKLALYRRTQQLIRLVGFQRLTMSEPLYLATRCEHVLQEQSRLRLHAHIPMPASPLSDVESTDCESRSIRQDLHAVRKDPQGQTRNESIGARARPEWLERIRPRSLGRCALARILDRWPTRIDRDAQHRTPGTLAPVRPASPRQVDSLRASCTYEECSAPMSFERDSGHEISLGRNVGGPTRCIVVLAASPLRAPIAATYDW